jgi:hypothetical protein
VPLHDALKALADRGACDIHELACEIVVGGDLFADLDHILGGDAELGYLALRLNFRLGEMAAQRLRRALRLAAAHAELHGRIPVRLLGALGYHLAIVHAQHGDRHVLAGLRIDAGHPHLLCNHA